METIREHVFFLTECGSGGFTPDSIWSMYLDEMVDMARRLKDKLEEERRIRQREADKAKQRAASQRARSKGRR